VSLADDERRPIIANGVRHDANGDGVITVDELRAE
jgi:hypothetical protein